MKRSNRPVPMLGLSLAVVVLAGATAYVAPKGHAAPAIDDRTTGVVLLQDRQVHATTLSTAASPDGLNDPVQPATDGQLAITGVSLLLRSIPDAASADVPTTGVTLRQLVDDHGVLPSKVVLPSDPWTLRGTERH